MGNDAIVTPLFRGEGVRLQSQSKLQNRYQDSVSFCDLQIPPLM